jgi:hypothetical protein
MRCFVDPDAHFLFVDEGQLLEAAEQRIAKKINHG